MNCMNIVQANITELHIFQVVSQVDIASISTMILTMFQESQSRPYVHTQYNLMQP